MASGQKKKFATSAVGWLLVFLALAGGIVYFAATQGKTPPPREQKGSQSIDAPREDSWIKGSKDAPFVLTEYSDFQCPACGRYYPLVKKFAYEHIMSVAVVYRHFPLTELHRNAMLASQAAEAAGKQGKFWQMHDRLFEDQSQWSDADGKVAFDRYAGELGLDLVQFDKDMQSRETKDRIERDRVSGIQAGVQGTPTFFLNGTLIETPGSYDDFNKLLQRSPQAK